MRTVLIVSAVLLTAFAPAPLPRRERGRDRHDPLQGAWVVKELRWRGNGNISGVYSSSGVSVSVRDKVTIGQGLLSFERQQPDQNLVNRWEYRTHGRAGAIDLAEEGGRQRKVPGLYHLDGSKLTLSFPSSGLNARRPDAIDRGDLVIILERR
jgi:hypothetical protein